MGPTNHAVLPLSFEACWWLRVPFMCCDLVGHLAWAGGEAMAGKVGCWRNMATRAALN